jgi:hypothetical protein
MVQLHAEAPLQFQGDSGRKIPQLQSGHRPAHRPIAGPSPQKSRPEVGRGDQAAFAATEPAVAAAGDNVVDPVAAGPGDEAEAEQEAPRTAEDFGDGEGGIAADQRLAVAVDEYGIKVVGVESGAAIEIAAGFGLDGGEFENGTVVVTEDEQNRGRTQIADAIKQDHVVWRRQAIGHNIIRSGACNGMMPFFQGRRQQKGRCFGDGCETKSFNGIQLPGKPSPLPFPLPSRCGSGEGDRHLS